MSLPRSVSFLFLLVVLVSAGCSKPGEPIPQAEGYDRLPGFVGAPAQPRPLPPRPIPAHPHLAPQGMNGMHADSYCSGSYPWAGPLGINPVVDSVALGTLGGLMAAVTFDAKGRIVGVSGDFTGFNLYLIDPATLKILATQPLPQRASMQEFFRTFDFSVIMNDTSGGAYFHLGDGSRPIIANADQVLQQYEVTGPDSSPSWRLVTSIDLKPSLPEGSLITNAVPDWEGFVWFVTRQGIVGVVDMNTSMVNTIDLPGGEEIQNAAAVAEDGVYIVSDYAMYRFARAPATNAPTVIWRMEYDRGGAVKPGSINQGSGTTPTLSDVTLPNGASRKLVGITDNADVRTNVLVYDRLTGELLCQHPVFDANFSTSENSLIGYGRSFIVENNYAFGDGTPLDPDPRGYPGVARIELDQNCTACHQVWESRESSQTTVPKLSVGNGLVYLYTRAEQAPAGVLGWYLTAIDFRTGETVYKVLTGTGLLWNNSYAPITVGPDGAVYVGVLNGLISVRDVLPTPTPLFSPTPLPTPESDSGPRIMLAGYMGGGSALVALMDTSGMIPGTMSVTLTDGFFPTELTLADDGLHGDLEARDGLYGVPLDLAGMSPGQELLGILAKPNGTGRAARWPWLEVR